MLDINELKKHYNGISTFKCGGINPKDPVDKWWQFKRYKLHDYKKEDNIGIHTGCEVYKDKYNCVLDVDIDVEKNPFVLKIILDVCKDTIIVKTRGKHNGLHIYYNLDMPTASGLFEIADIGFIELKCIDTNGRNSAILLPPSIVGDKKYNVIHPEESNYIDFNKVKNTTINGIDKILLNIKKRIDENKK